MTKNIGGTYFTRDVRSSLFYTESRTWNDDDKDDDVVDLKSCLQLHG